MWTITTAAMTAAVRHVDMSYRLYDVWLVGCGVVYRGRWTAGRVCAVIRHCISIVFPLFARTGATDCELYIIWLYRSACTHIDTIDWAHSHARLRVQKTISHDNIIIIIITWSPHNEAYTERTDTWHTYTPGSMWYFTMVIILCTDRWSNTMCRCSSVSTTSIYNVRR